MPSAKLVLKRAWAQLDAETLAYKPFTPDEKDGVPPKRTRQYLFPVLFSERALSGPLVLLTGELSDELASLAMTSVFLQKDDIRATVRWHLDMVEYYNGLRRSGEGLFLGDSSEAKILKPAFGAAQAHRGPTSDEERARIVRSRVEGMRGAKALTAASVDEEYRRKNSDYQKALDDAWQTGTINDQVTLSLELQTMLGELTGHFSTVKVDTATLTDESTAELIWQSIVSSNDVDTQAAPLSLQLSDFKPVEQPPLEREPGIGLPDNVRRPLDRSVKGRITRMLGSESSLTANADRALGIVIAASANAYGLSSRESRAVLLLGEYLRYSLHEQPQDNENPGAVAMSRSWMRGGVVGRAIADASSRYDAARAFAEQGVEEYYLLRLWGRLLRAEVAGATPSGALAAWTEMLAATTSTREHIRSLKAPVSELPPPPPGSDDTPPEYQVAGSMIQLIVSIVDVGAESESEGRRFLRRVYAYHPPITANDDYQEDRKTWNDWRRLYLEKVDPNSPDTVDDTPSFPEAIMHMQRLATRRGEDDAD